MTLFSLFRPKALEAVKNRGFGSVSINTPRHYQAWVLVCVGCFAGLLMFVCLADFADHHLIQGYLNTEQGIAQVYTNQVGVVTRCEVTQSAHVKRGDSLCVVDVSYEGASRVRNQELSSLLCLRMQKLHHIIVAKRRQLRALKPLVQQRYIPRHEYDAGREALLQLENQHHALAMELIQYRESHEYVVRSPIDGVVSSVMVQVGQQASLAKPLLSILPEKAQLMVELYLPASQAGFVHINDDITIRYDAYPYTRFGTAKAKIQTISQTVLTDEDEIKPIRIGQPYYKIRARLEKQEIRLAGVLHRLRQGMTLSAVVAGERKTMAQWLLGSLHDAKDSV